jgi:hypothetical protein
MGYENSPFNSEKNEFDYVRESLDKLIDHVQLLEEKEKYKNNKLVNDFSNFDQWPPAVRKLDDLLNVTGGNFYALISSAIEKGREDDVREVFLYCRGKSEKLNKETANKTIKEIIEI